MSSNIIALRSYQQEAIDAVQRDWQDGLRSVAVVLPTGSGKTVTFANMCDNEVKSGGKPLILVHRDELVQQAKKKIQLIAPDITVGVVKADQNETDAHVVVGSVQTLRKQQRLEQLTDITMIIIDECFPAGTLVGGRPIEAIRVGDTVASWDEETGCETSKTVVATMKKKPSNLVQVKFEDGQTVISTANHPFMTDKGWCPAELLTNDASVLSFTHDSSAGTNELQFLQNPDCDNRTSTVELEKIGERVLHKSMRNVCDRELFQEEGQSLANYSLCGMQSSCEFEFALKEQTRCVPQNKKGLLLCDMQRGSSEKSFFRNHGSHEQKVCLCQNAEKESDAFFRDTRENVSNFEKDSARAEVSERQRERCADSSEEACRHLRLADGNCYRPEGWPASLSLQGGHSSSYFENLHRSGRRISFLEGAPRVRPKKGRKAVFLRVVDVSILEQGSDGTYGGLCPDGYVYNIEVEGTHTYTVGNGIVVHNCHHAAANSYVTITKHYPHARVVGFTATLQREDSKKLGDIFQKVSYQKDIEFGITHGFLCDVEGRTVEVPDLDLQSVNQRRGDFADEALAEALEESEAGKFIAEAYREHCPNRRGVLFAPNVATANLFANDLKDAGFSTEVIVGTTPLDERAEIYRRFEKGTTQILSSVGVLTEGWDAPWAHVAVIARPTRSQGLYTQMAGRVLRPWAGKDKALILDVVGAARQFPLATIADLSKTKPKIKDGETLGEALEREAKEKKPGRSTTGLKFEAIDLFHKSTSVWMQTYSGVWFIPVREATYFIWPEAETEWTVGRTPKYGRPERLRTGLDMALAMSWAEQLATDEDSSISSRKASWRRRKSVPTDAQKTTAARCGLDIAGKTKVEVSDMLSVYFASKLFPNGYPTY